MRRCQLSKLDLKKTWRTFFSWILFPNIDKIVEKKLFYNFVYVKLCVACTKNVNFVMLTIRGTTKLWDFYIGGNEPLSKA